MTYYNTKYQTISYDELKDKILPLDIIVNSREKIHSCIIKAFQYIFNSNHNGDWSHAIVVSDNNISINGNGRILVLGSDSEGVHSYDFIDDLKSKDCIFAYCKLKNNPFIKKEDETIEEYNKRIYDVKTKINNFCNKYKGKRYEYIWHLPKAVLCCWSCCQDTDDNIFCSELVVKLYQEIGLINESIDAETISPGEIFEIVELEKPVIIQ